MDFGGVGMSWVSCHGRPHDASQNAICLSDVWQFLGDASQLPKTRMLAVDQNKVLCMGTLKKLAQVKHNCPIHKVCGLLWALDAPRTNFITGSN